MRYVTLIILTICTFVIVASCIASIINPAMQLALFAPMLCAMWVGMFTVPAYHDARL